MLFGRTLRWQGISWAFRLGNARKMPRHRKPRPDGCQKTFNAFWPPGLPKLQNLHLAIKSVVMSSILKLWRAKVQYCRWIWSCGKQKCNTVVVVKALAIKNVLLSSILKLRRANHHSAKGVLQATMLYCHQFWSFGGQTCNIVVEFEALASKSVILLSCLKLWQAKV